MPSAPTPAEVEALAKEYRELDTKIAEIAKKAAEEAKPHVARIDELRKLLIEKVREFGSAHEKKSKLLYGLELEVMGTFGSTTTIDSAAVETFRDGLKKAKLTRLLNQVFEKTIRWTLKPEAPTVLSAAHDAKRLPSKLFLLFVRCAVPKDATPRLVVRPKQPA